MFPDLGQQREGKDGTEILCHLSDVCMLREVRSIRGDHERTLRDVCITIYWLGKAAKKVKGYEGPHLDESKFQELIVARPMKGVSCFVSMQLIGFL